MEYQISEPRWTGPDMIDVIWVHPYFGPIPYTAVNSSGEEEMQAIWDGLMRGDYGPVAPMEGN